ncbi:MAG: hypothetical protein HQL46_02865 [Gammaproteobacteria bacterium]|nr:hypothetical protein [Gammaproteobacteria bacterium]
MNSAVLLSAFICPGLGHLLLNKYRLGISLMTASAISLLILLYQLTQRATEIIKSIQSVEIEAMDIARIVEMLFEDAFYMRAAASVLLILWVIGIVDSYRLSRKYLKKQKVIPIKIIS